MQDLKFLYKLKAKVRRNSLFIVAGLKATQGKSLLKTTQSQKLLKTTHQKQQENISVMVKEELPASLSIQYWQNSKELSDYRGQKFLDDLIENKFNYM